MITETIYISRDNVIEINLGIGNLPDGLEDLEDLSKVQIIINGTIYDSDTLGLGEDGVFDNSDEYDEGILKLQLGGLSGLAVGTYLCDLILFTEDSSNGVVWGKLRLRVKDV